MRVSKSQQINENDFWFQKQVSTLANSDIASPGFKNTSLPRPFWVGSPTDCPEGGSRLVRKASTRPDRERRPDSFTRPPGSSWWASRRTLHPSAVSSPQAVEGRRWGTRDSLRLGVGRLLPALSPLATQPNLLVFQKAGTDRGWRGPLGPCPPGKAQGAHIRTTPGCRPTTQVSWQNLASRTNLVPGS